MEMRKISILTINWK